MDPIDISIICFTITTFCLLIVVIVFGCIIIQKLTKIHMTINKLLKLYSMKE
jgi:hypothetical protein